MSYEIVRCPKCYSDQLYIGQKGFSLGKAALGVVTIGAIGALAGLHGKNKIELNCLKCGNRWTPNYNNSTVSTYNNHTKSASASVSQPVYSPPNKSYAPWTDKDHIFMIRWCAGITIFNLLLAAILLITKYL